jgi:hypothetical protein
VFFISLNKSESSSKFRLESFANFTKFRKNCVAKFRRTFFIISVIGIGGIIGTGI